MEHDKDLGAGLIHQVASPRDGTEPRLNFNATVKAIQAEAGRYLAWLNSSKPLNDEYKAIKGRIVTLACQLRNAQPQPAWQSIETAPKDGSYVLAHCGGGAGVDLAFWDAMEDGGRGGWNSYRDCAAVEPTHWMPLPAPPDSGTK